MNGAGPSHSTHGRHVTRLLQTAAALVALAMVVTACSGRSAKNDHDDDTTKGSDGGRATQVDTLGLQFTNVTTEAGLDAPQSPAPYYGEDSMTSGAAVADVDGDGFDDILLTRAGMANILYLNNGDGTFRDATIESGLAESQPTYGSSAAAFFDADGDGSLDLFTTGFGRGRNRLYMNDGHGRFTDATVDRGVVFPPLPASSTMSQMHGVSIGDVNGDGAPDLLVLHWYTDGLSDYADAAYTLAGERGMGDPSLLGACEISALMDEVQPSVDARRDDSTGSTTRSASRLFINDGTGHFTDGTEQWGLSFDRTLAFTGVFVDYDGDGYQDLAVTGDGCSSRLYRNVEGRRFEDVTARAFPHTDENAMGAVFTDIDGDGLADWVLSSIAYGSPGQDCPVGGSLVGCSGNRVYLNEGDGTFTDATDDLGLRDGGWGWGLAVEDFTNTGHPSVVMTNGYMANGHAATVTSEDAVASDDANPYTTFITPFSNDTTRFWMHHPDGRFVDVAQRVGIADAGLGHALVAFDYDNDGDLDILIANSHDRPVLYRNDTPKDRSWLTIRLHDPTSPGNRWGDGARIEVFPDTTDTVDPADDTDSAGAADSTDPSNGRAGRRVGWITTTGSYESQKPAQFHLGFGDRDEPVARIDVYWPGTTEPQSITDVELNQRLVIERR